MSRPVRHLLLSAVVFIGLGSSSALEAQEDTNISARVDDVDLALRAFRPSGDLQINLDGRIDEDVWQNATAITDFTQQEPVEGNDPSEPTEIRVVFDDDNLYIGAIIYDDPEQVLAFQRERDASLGTDDRFMWILDTFLDGRT
ncbi:MAG: hypothetical protein L7S64_03405, partial [Longimicrobiales bacterium]|nr:hypothetical protein [Longimicrobiales bacterium]